MYKTLLAFNFTAERLQALKLICMMLKVMCRPVQRAEMLQPVGYLAGIKEIAPLDAVYEGGENQPEMLLLCGFERRDLDRLLAAIKKSRLRQVGLKAMLTPHNVHWSGLRLLKELGEEHALMRARAAGAAPGQPAKD